MEKKELFTYDMTFEEAIKMNKDTLKVLKKFNIHCSACSGKVQESIRAGAVNHGIDPAELLAELNKL